MKKSRLFSLLFLSFSSWLAYSQIPYHVPKPSNNTPVDWSKPADLILYLIIPGIFILFGIINKINKKKSKS